jgi:6-phosphogluconolactonase (cycloisomerase 2 family)
MLQPGQKCYDSLYFAKKEKIILFNFFTKEITNFVHFEVPLSRQPEFFLMNENQNVSIVASADDGTYYNHRSKSFKDLDAKFKITSIKALIHDNEDGRFYILSNKFQQKLGIFLIMFDDEKPN